MPELRTTVLIAAPMSTVSGALIEIAARRAQVVSVSASRIAARLPPRPFRGARLAGQSAATGAGTLLTCSLSWVSPGFFVRRAVLSLLGSVADGVRVRAESLVDAPVVVGTAIVRDGLLLAQQRGFPADVAGMWELPGGRVEPGETDLDAVRRECVEELGVEVAPGDQLGPDVILPSGKLLRIYAATVPADAQPVAREHKALRWVRADEVGGLDWLPADRIILPALRFS
jgi:8-oxo-dGTP diphosphatase